MAIFNKNAITFSLFFAFISIYPQKTISQVRHMDRYRINFPEEWKKPKIIRAVTFILSSTVDELKDRDFCTEGQALYYVFLYIDSITFKENAYSFYASFRTFDSTGRAIVDLRLVSGSEIFDKTKDISFGEDPTISYSQLGPNVDITTFNNDNTFILYKMIIDSSRDLRIMEICKKRIFQLKKRLQKLSEN